RKGAPLQGEAAAPEALGTRLYVNLALPGQAEEAAALPVDGVGLLRAEFMLTEALGGVHPRKLIAEGRGREFVERMSGALLSITRAFRGRPVVYRTTDFRTNEFRGLEGGSDFEATEANPMIGFRGCYRYLREPQVFQLELEVLARVREETPNLHLMIPFADEVGAGGVPGGRGRKPAGTPARAGALGDGGGALRRLPHPGVRAHGHHRRVHRLQ
ncbi:putative PEP-binding protein, partial [Corallococcus sp. 4LFB]|uniref:putative PEP-binding protein n=1 Tax=Corallococcus sp. 4LFB TaxID=3383249 RepID=UPI003976C573